MTRGTRPAAAPAAPAAGDERIQTPLPIEGATPAPAAAGGDSGAMTTPVLPPPTVRATGAATLPGVAPGGLLLPVQGITTAQLQDTFTDSRSEGRSHDAIDIMAPAGTPVLAVADGPVEKLFDSKQGGITLYQFDPQGTRAYYYAHLQGYAPGIAEKQVLKRGDVLGYVGATGNANPAAPHLHFAVFVLGPEKQWWKGEAINPYPLLGGVPR
jgi:murein DD-endopeptidase MepM/ murein hydrolase activator NlpD